MAFTYYFAVLQCKANVSKMGWILFPVHILHTMNELIKQTFEGQNITFKNQDNVMYVNATEMAKAFGKLVSNWTQLDSTIEYVNELSLIIGIPIIKLINKQAGRYGGTWMHEDVAMEFARWLSPKFAIWCNKQIKQLLTTGKTEIQPQYKVPQSFSEALRLAANLQEELENKKNELEQKDNQLEEQQITIDCLKDTNETNRPKVEYYEQAMNADGLYTITQIAKEFNKSAKEFNIMLHNLGIQYNVNGQWLLYSKYSGMDLTKTKTYMYDREGRVERRLQTLWTEKGRKFIYELMNKSV